MIELFKLAGAVTVTGLKEANKQLTSFEKGIKSSIKPLVTLGRQAKSTGQILTRNITAPLAAIGVSAAKFAGDFQKSMTTSLAIMGDVSEGMRDQMAKTAKTISTETTFSASELAKSYYYLASAGMTAEQSIAALGKVAQFAQAGQFDLQIATDLLTDAQSALGLSAEDAAENQMNLVRVSDVLVKANTLANASVQQFSEALTNKAAASLRILGKDVEEGTAILAAFADQGTKGAEAGTQLSIVLRDLQKANLTNSEEFKNAKIAVYDTAGEMRNLADIIGDIETALEGKSDAEKKAQLSILGFQEKSVQSLMTLIGTSEAIRDYEKELRVAAGTTEEVSKKQIKNFNDQMKIMWNRIQVVAIEIGNELLPVLQNDLLPIFEKMVKAISTIVKIFNALPSPIKKFIVSIGLIAAALGPVLLVLGNMIMSLQALPALLVAAKVAIGLFITAISSGALPIIGIVAGITALVAIVIKLTERQRQANKVQKTYNQLMKATGEESKYLKKQFEDEADKLAELNKKYERNIEKRRILNGLLKNEEYLKKSRTEQIKMARELVERNEQYNDSASNSYQMLNQSRQAYEEETKKKESNTRITKENTTSVKENTKAIEDNSEARTDAILAEFKAYTDQQMEFEKLDAEKAKTKDDESRKSFERTMEGVRNFRNAKQEEERIEKELAEEVKRIEAEKHQARIESVVSFTQQSIGLFQGMYDNEAINIDNNYKRRKRAIENTEKSEEEKTAALARLDEEFDKKRAALQKKQMIAEKAQSIFSIGVNTASAIIRALVKPGGIAGLVLSGIMGVMGAAQAAIVAAKPIPEMAEGGIIPKSSGGTLVNAGEAGEDEGFIPMKKGTASIANAIINNMRRFPGVLNDTAGMATGTATGSTVNLNVGTLIADEKGLSDLEKRLKAFRIAENNRLGVV